MGPSLVLAAPVGALLGVVPVGGGVVVVVVVVRGGHHTNPALTVGGAVVRSFLHHTDRVTCLALLSEGRRFVSGSWDGTARIVEHGLVL